MLPNAAEELRTLCETKGLRSLALNTMALNTERLASLISRTSPSEELILVRQAPENTYRQYPPPIFTLVRAPHDPELYRSWDHRLTTDWPAIVEQAMGKPSLIESLERIWTEVPVDRNQSVPQRTLVFRFDRSLAEVE